MYLKINAFALSGRTNNNTIIPRVSLRLPWAMRSLGFQPVLPQGVASLTLGYALIGLSARPAPGRRFAYHELCTCWAFSPSLTQGVASLILGYVR